VSSTIPTLLLSGDFDPITPPPMAQAAAQTLQPSYTVEFPVYGHGAVTSGNCPNEIMLAFVQNPQAPPNTQCARENGKVSFITPSDYMLARGLGAAQYAMLQGKIGPFWLPLGALLVLLSVFAAGPILWLVRRSQKRPAPATRWGKLAPWLAAAAGVLASVFFAVLVILLLVLALRDNSTVALIVGLPRTAAPLFVLPIVFVVTALLLVASSLVMWRRNDGGRVRRVYYSLTALAAIVLSVWFLFNGMLTVWFT